MTSPLADRIRPQDFSDIVGQTHLFGKNGALTKMQENNYITNMIFYGPSGTGKTITIQYKDGHEDNFGVDNVEEEFAKLEKFVQQMFEPIRIITPEEGELPFGMV